MPYNIGQVRRSEISSFSSDIQYTQGTVLNEDAIVNFYDPCLFLSGSSVVSSLYSYYLKFTITQQPDLAQNFTIKLKNSESETDNVENIRSFTVKQGTESTTFELIFHPVDNFNEIIFELSRTASDFNIENADGTSGRLMDLTVIDFYLVLNVISNTLSTLYPGLTTLSKIGIQGPPGLMFVIDGEEIRLGRSGIYELYNENIEVSYIGFIINDSSFTQDGQDFFIMDFKY